MWSQIQSWLLGSVPPQYDADDLLMGPSAHPPPPDHRARHSSQSSADTDPNDAGLRWEDLPVALEPLSSRWVTGRITREDADSFLIDGHFYWPKTLSPKMIHGRGQEALGVDWQVRAQVVVMHEHEAPKVRQVSDAWPPSSSQATEDWIMGPSETELLVEDLHEKLDLLDASTGLVRSLASVESIRAGQIALNLGLDHSRSINVPLSSLGLHYVPWTGDLLSVDLNLDQVDMTKAGDLPIQAARPLRTLEGPGSIQSYWTSDDRGLLSGDVFFNQSSCPTSYRPRRGDEVRFQAVECQPGPNNKYANWRAHRVVPQVNGDGLRAKRLVFENLAHPSQRKFRQERLKAQNGIFTPDQLDLGAIDSGNVVNVEIPVENRGNVNQTLLQVEAGPNVDLSALDRSCLPIVVPDNGSLVLKLECHGRVLGRQEQLISLHFDGDFCVGTELKFCVGHTKISEIMRGANVVPNGERFRHQYNRNGEAAGMWQNQSGYIPGRKSVYKPKATYNKNYLPQYEIPSHLWRDVLDAGGQPERLSRLYPALNDQLCLGNYKLKFSSLIYLEEIALWQQIRRYDLQDAVLFHAGPYLSLEVPGLAEKRPSLMIGDSAVLRLVQRAPGNEIFYEGCIQEVRSKSVLLLFTEHFHSTYGGEAYEVSFQFNRSGFRRMHQAVEMALATSGANILFPEKVCLLPAQVADQSLNENALKAKRIIRQKVYPSSSVLNIESNSSVCSLQSISDQCEASLSLTPSPSEKKIKKKKRSSVAERLFGQKISTSIPEVHEVQEVNPDFTLPVVKDRLDFDYQKYAAMITRTLPHRFTVQPPPIPQPGTFPPYTARKRRGAKRRKNPWVNSNLNQEQRKAVRRILLGEARPLPYIIYGPPGTGKTVTLVEAILQIFLKRPDSRILVATPSNSSADLVAERLWLSKVLQVGDLARLNAFQRSEDSIPDKIKALCFKSQDTTVLSRVIRHRIVISTCSSAGGLYKLGIRGGHFTHCFIDEAGHLTEPETMIAFGLVSQSQKAQLVLAGDPKQLGPVLQSKLAKIFGLEQSFLERITTAKIYARDSEKFKDHGGYDPVLVTKLVRNYRSHDAIIHMSSKLFYDSELSAQGELALRNRFIGMSFLPNPDIPIIFHGIKGFNCQEGDCPSWFNPVEAFQTSKFVRLMYGEGKVNPTELGVIAPYRKQVEKVRHLLTSLELDLPRIGSVEEFQGQEMPVIIITTVRSADMSDADDGVEFDILQGLGFLQSEKRFNVAMTRAQSLLIVLGDPHLLALDETWFQFLKYCCVQRAYQGCDLPLSLCDI
ncbi:hypothetical protein TCAL_00662 [Tigriopus californicus]|uniref:RNA helicase n=1 Tax=Tigriopus californicus TaxID=6832 RepID=A0A553PBS6_TIGCA|nr:RNA helicase Mov10l1-like [Tigriopus californicus]TRY75130.1 hypothetical protein TCAL_00662 [Tigriopus californicus]